MNRYYRAVFTAACFAIGAGDALSQITQKHLKISGVYPHLATFNESWPVKENLAKSYGQGAENGIGAIVPWNNSLWMVTYSPHEPNGSADKLYSIDNKLNVQIHPESIGGTPANRLIHHESNQLIISNYFVDDKGKVRVIPFSKMPGRMTATARHLHDPANMVYFYDMEGALYQVNVHTLAVEKLFHKPVPGWHGKGAYTSQGLLVVANNGEEPVFKITGDMLKAGSMPKSPDDMGVLASWDGNTWKIVERKQFTDVTGPGGIYGAPDNKSPLWSIGWDKRSVILKLLDKGDWYTYRLPKAAHTYDHRGGWYTEWPRIREVGNGKMLMDMHGMMYDFPKTFSRKNTAGILPLSSHLRYIPDFCNWNGQLVLATDETTVLANPMAGRAQSNLWFGKWEDLTQWGGATGWGGPWVNDTVKAKIPSDPYLIAGFGKRILHLTQKSGKDVIFTLQIDRKGDNTWSNYSTLTVPASGYLTYILPAGLSAQWIRITANTDCIATAFFHFTGKMHETADAMFNSLADISTDQPFQSALIRPANFNKNLQVLTLNKDRRQYSEINEKIQVERNIADSSSQMDRLLALKKSYTVDKASPIIKDRTGTFRIPRGASGYENFQYRDKREIESERFMLNIQGTFYEVGREAGFIAMRPVTTHHKKIVDFCTWRGLLVMSGTRAGSIKDGHYFGEAEQGAGLWYGAVDDLWKLGKPKGEGAVWIDSEVKDGQESLPFLMTGYDQKQVRIVADKDVTITLLVDFDLNGFHKYKSFDVKANRPVIFQFPDGFSAHWVKAHVNKACKTTVDFIYR